MVSICCRLKYDLPPKSGLFGNKKVLNFCKKYTINYLHKIYTQTFKIQKFLTSQRVCRQEINHYFHLFQ